MKSLLEQCRNLTELPREYILEQVRAKELTVEFIRSQDHIAIYKGKGTGRTLSAWEAYTRYPKEIFLDILKYGVAAIGGNDEPAKTIKKRREEMSLTEADLASHAKVSIDDIRRAESEDSDTSIQILEKIWQKLGLDDSTLSFARWEDSPSPPVNCLKKKMSVEFEIDFGKKDILLFSDSAWINLTQERLFSWLNGNKEWKKFSPSDTYIHKNLRPYQFGYSLAKQTRKALDIPETTPVHNLRNLCEQYLGITCIERPLPATIAGLAVSHGDSRYMIINKDGSNINPLVKRITLAHELAHILWDPDNVFSEIRPDKYDSILKIKRHNKRQSQTKEFKIHEHAVEARASAFAIEFLLPHAACPVSVMPNDVENVIKSYMINFGTSFSSTCWHMINKGLFDEEQVHQCYIDTMPKTSWAKEDIYYEQYPITSTPYERRGWFTFLTARALNEGFISVDTAASYLNTNPSMLEEHLEELLRPCSVVSCPPH